MPLFSRNSHKYTISTPKWLQVAISHWNSHIFTKSSDSIRGSYFFAVPDLDSTHFNFLCVLITLYVEEVMRMGMSFADMHPELASEFSERNLPLTVSDITYGSNKKYWWIGKCGHEWLASPKSRHSGEGCPYCAGMRVLEGFNDLASIKPELVDEWSSENEPLKPNNVNAASHRKVKWKGKCGHEWTAEIRARVKGTGCPYCSNNKIMPGFNDLATIHPELVKEWSPRNLPWTPDQAPAGANRMVWWRCEKGHEWETLISTRAGGSKCPFCSGIKLLKGFNDLKTKQPELAEEWSERNMPLLPEDVNEKSRLNVWWKCSTCGYEWQSVVHTRVHGGPCPVCANRKVKQGINDLATTDPDIAQEWDYTKNEGTPSTVSRYSMKRAWWKGSCGHSWNAIIYNRTVNGEGCLECEKEFKSVLPQLAVLYYAGKYGLKAKLNDESAIGIHLDTYIPSIGIAIETGGIRNSKIGIEEYGIKRLQCKKQGIKLYTITEGNVPNDRYIIPKGNSSIDLLNAVLTAFKRSNIYIEAEPEKDIETIRQNYFCWRYKKRK